jgi:nitrate reductase molybdenum cofactor assembly chaperone
MQTQISKRPLCSQVGFFLEYPARDFLLDLQGIIKQLEDVSEAGAFYMKEFLSKMESVDLIRRQEYYVQSFDLTPHCPLYVSVHLFGEESFKRAELMAGLKAVYERNGAFEMTELPDHLAVILKHNALFEEQEWIELIEMAMLPILPVMIAKLEKNKNPYVFVVRTIQELLTKSEKAHV